MAHQVTGLDRVLLAGSNPECNQTAERSERAKARLEGLAPRHLEDDVDLLAPIGLDYRPVEITRARVDGAVCAELEREPALLLRGGEGDHIPGAHSLRQLDREAPRASGGSVDHDRLTRCHPPRDGKDRVGGQPLW